jgi:hypothetical protein
VAVFVRQRAFDECPRRENAEHFRGGGYRSGGMREAPFFD